MFLKTQWWVENMKQRKNYSIFPFMQIKSIYTQNITYFARIQTNLRIFIQWAPIENKRECESETGGNGTRQNGRRAPSGWRGGTRWARESMTSALLLKPSRKNKASKQELPMSPPLWIPELETEGCFILLVPGIHEDFIKCAQIPLWSAHILNDLMSLVF